MAEIIGKIDFDAMLNSIPPGEGRERAAVELDKFLGIEHIPTEGYEKRPLTSSLRPAKDMSLEEFLNTDPEDWHG